MPTPARIQETLLAWGFRKQTNISTANTALQMWSMNKLNVELHRAQITTENDAAELGKGHEFPTIDLPVSWDVQGRLEKYLASDFAAWVMAFSLGHVVETGTSPNFIYTITPALPAVDGIELPYFSYVEQIRPGGSAVLDHMVSGCMVSGWTLTVGSGPGRANSKLVADFVGTGQLTEPSGITIPSALAEKYMLSATLAMTVNGTDYVSTKKIVSFEATWNNNPLLDAGYFPGSGTQNGAALRGRIEYGARTLGLKFTARFENASTELAAVTSQSSGTAVLTLDFDANNSLQLTFQKIVFSAGSLSNVDGLVTVDITTLPMYDPTNGLITAVAKCTTDQIAQ